MTFPAQGQGALMNPGGVATKGDWIVGRTDIDNRDIGPAFKKSMRDHPTDAARANHNDQVIKHPKTLGLYKLVGVEGLEPTTYWLEASCLIHFATGAK